MLVAQHIRVSGVVQGVGFRPFVWRLARELALAGWVRNDSGGVEISAEGSEAGVHALIERLRQDAPPLARIDAISASPRAPRGLNEFSIAASVADRCATTIGADTGLCDECLAELFDPGNRRWRHAFITCTHCGPRYTVARSLPYDRARTSMDRFALCADCTREYTNPEDRRFHAEPIACSRCGPRLRLVDATGHSVEGDPIEAAFELLRQGAIVAIKSLGGYHLACNARDAAAVSRLRERKNREAKPFAVMAANLASLETLVCLTQESRELLTSPARPIVLTPKAAETDSHLTGIAPSVACLGVMLPSNPLQWLLLHEAAGRPPGTDWLRHAQPTLLVMTSANRSGEPLIIDDGTALDGLRGIADAFLQHDREIVARCDDSVVMPGTPLRFVRRARGYVPEAIRLPATGPGVLAVGAHLKNTICVTRGDEAFVSAHIGDLDDVATFESFQQSIERMLGLLEVEPTVIAHDLHPDMPSTLFAAEWATRRSIPAVAVQHHHAHVAAVVAEYGVRGPVLGVTLDGVGFGLDGTAWGGELLRVEDAYMHRVGHLAPLPLPGGDRAAREPWRMAAAVLHRMGQGADIARRFGRHPASGQLERLLDRSLNCPSTSSMGRVFDAAAALLGVSETSRYEAEAAMRLEACARRASMVTNPDLWRLDASGELDLLPLLATLADWTDNVDRGAALFHATAAKAVSQWAIEAAARERLSTVILAGGCFLNDLLHSAVMNALCAAGLRVLSPLRLPPNDGGISLGQAWIVSRLGGL